MVTEISGLVAYASRPTEIGQTICSALEELKKSERFHQLSGWEEVDIPGRFISNEVLNLIENGNIFLADITQLNFNVVYEIGYAIGCKRRAFLIKNKIIQPESDLISQVGIFDTLGYVPYETSKSLAAIITEITDLNPLYFDERDTSRTTPVYIVLPQIKGDIETRLIARIKKGRLFYRSFDPAEHGRLSALEAIENVAKSHGVVIPLLPHYYINAEVHNLRAAFVAGLSQGMRKVLLMLQSGDDPIPLDYRDLVRRFTFPEQIDEYVNDFGLAVTESFQSVQPPLGAGQPNLLARLILGSSAAENEFQELGWYYLETDEFRRALRGEVRVVRGRKGAGKTALFFQLRDRIRRNKKNIVLDLKPEGFQLLKFKEQVLDYLEEGTREHTITAFWEYLLLLEVCHKLLQTDKERQLRDHELYIPYQELSRIYDTDEYIAEGDFSERMLRLTRRIADDFATRKDSDKKLRLSSEEITQLLYKHDLNALSALLITYLQHKQSMWILFDNLDKGWPPHGISPEDVITLRCLIEALSKLERSFKRAEIQTTGVVFIRNDVYENLVAATADRGKISCVLVDWSDRALLLELLRRRFLCTDVLEDQPFEDLWHLICVSHIRGEETSNYMLDRCLMRPRSLIELVSFCRSHAVNLGHSRIEVEDIENGEEQYSTQLVGDLCYEIRDVFPPAKDALYEFIECPFELDETLLHSILAKLSEDADIRNKIFDLLLWYGFLGFRGSDDEPTYIYSVRYDMKRFGGLLKKRAGEDLRYVVNPAFWKGLEIVV